MKTKNYKKDTPSTTNKLFELNIKGENLIDLVMSKDCSNFGNPGMPVFKSLSKELLKGFMSARLGENLEKIRQASGKLLNKGNIASVSKGADYLVKQVFYIGANPAAFTKIYDENKDCVLDASSNNPGTLTREGIEHCLV